MKICIPAPFMILLLLPTFQGSRVCRGMIFHTPLYTTSELKIYFEGYTTTVKLRIGWLGNFLRKPHMCENS